MIDIVYLPVIAAAVFGLGACVTLPAPGPAPRPAVAVAAPVDTTWQAVLDQLLQRNMAIHSVDRGAGFISTRTMALPPFPADPGAWADCGTFAGFGFAPAVVDLTVLIRGDSTASSVKTSARYRLRKGPGEIPTDCVSKGVFEGGFDASVKQHAEIAPTGRFES